MPIPSKLPGRVLGFQIPARRISTLPVAASLVAVAMTCSSVSALHGPEMIKGFLFKISSIGFVVFNVCIMVYDC